MTEQMVPAVGTAWVEHETTYEVEYLTEDGDWDCDYDEAESATDAISLVKELVDDEEIEPGKVRVVETLKIRRVMLLGEVEARAKRERGE